MKVYEMIQELVRHDPDAEVIIDFTTKEDSCECECGKETDFEREEKTSTDLTVVKRSNEFYKVHIICEEN